MRKLLLIAATMLLVSSVSAQQEVILESVTNSISEFQLIGGQTHVFKFRFRNFPPGACATAGFKINNGFVITSPDGATWGHTAPSLTDAFLSLSWDQASARSSNDPFSPFPFGGDGISPDFVSVRATSSSAAGGLRAGFDDIALEIEIVSNLADSNLFICIDKSEIGNLAPWAWTGINRAECDVAPDWTGKCFVISQQCCVGEVGNVDFDDAGVVDISDLTVLIDHLFINFPPLICDDEANIDGDIEGRVDISDLTVLIDHLFINFPPLPSCQ